MKMTERELSIIRALGEEFSTVLADWQRTFEEDGRAGTSVERETGFPVGGITEAS